MFSLTGRTFLAGLSGLSDNSPVIVVAEPVFEKGLPPMGSDSEDVLVKYLVTFRVQKVFKADRDIKPGDVIFTRLAVFAEFAEDRTFELKEGRSKIRFLRKTEYEKKSFENTSIWFGVIFTRSNEKCSWGSRRRKQPTRNPSNERDESPS